MARVELNPTATTQDFGPLLEQQGRKIVELEDALQAKYTELDALHGTNEALQAELAQVKQQLQEAEAKLSQVLDLTRDYNFRG